MPVVHLDRPSPLSPNSKQNRLLAAAHQDPHKILAWSPRPHNDQPFDPQNPFPADQPAQDQLYAAPTGPQQSRPGPVTPSDSAQPALSHASSPSSPVDGNSTSPNRDRSSSLSPAPDSGSSHTHPEPHSSPPPPPPTSTSAQSVLEPPNPAHDDSEPRVDKTSRQSTPLSELSQEDEVDAAPAGPPKSGETSPSEMLPDGSTHDSPKAETNSTAGKPQSSLNGQASLMEPTQDDAAPPLTDSQASGESRHGANANSTSNPYSPSSLSIESPLTPIAPSIIPGALTQQPPDSRVIFVLKLNVELLGICVDFQKKGINPTDPRFQQYSMRLQSNLTWLASAADHGRQGTSIPLPIVEPPVPVDTPSNIRVQQCYVELRSMFASDIARRHSSGGLVNNIPTVGGANPPNSLKRDRPDDLSADLISKRRDTGESKSPSMMMPPPSSIPITNPAQPTPSQFPVNITNSPSMPRSPQLPDSAQAAMINQMDPQLAARRQAQMRAMQQQGARQMSPQAQGMGGMNPGANALAGSSNPTAVNGNPGAANSGQPTPQQMYQMLQMPNHPFVQYMLRNVPNFQSMPVQMQVQKMLIAQNEIRHHQEQRAQQNRNQMQNGMMPQQFPQNANPMSPISHQSQAASSTNNVMYPMGNAGQANAAGMDPRMMNPQGLPQGMNNMSQQQRQLYLMQQQARAGNNVNPAMMMSPQQQMAYAAQQQRLAQQGATPSHPGSPMPGNDNFPALRSNATIPGIARSTRSPSDSAPSPMTPRTPNRGPSMNQEDYQRMMMQNQARGLAGSQNAAMMQQQQQQQQQQQMGGGNWGQPGQSHQGLANQGGNFSMPSGNVGSPYVGATSPLSNGQNAWLQQYPFSQTTSGVVHQADLMQGNPSVQQQSSMQSQNPSPQGDILPTDFDLFQNWAQ
ncbi:hypothetical protein BDN72DRAFT_955719 [Pluteus cervinus]|uniref:Uncharacterized protein n=1 Tax=Pluteus cervinus TaxID=181527 RepID=A0ACD3B8L1_9AGAR|nr:hypothetical protein BDN72DRAFT_955719 [Pluteus cervinus]